MKIEETLKSGIIMKKGKENTETQKFKKCGESCKVFYPLITY